MESAARSNSITSDSAATGNTAVPVFFYNKVCLTQAELIELKWQENFSVLSFSFVIIYLH